jgi:hypothetical protein
VTRRVFLIFREHSVNFFPPSSLLRFFYSPIEQLILDIDSTMLSAELIKLEKPSNYVTTQVRGTRSALSACLALKLGSDSDDNLFVCLFFGALVARRPLPASQLQCPVDIRAQTFDVRIAKRLNCFSYLPRVGGEALDTMAG